MLAGLATGLTQIDRVRRWQGDLIERLGFGPLEMPSRLAFSGPGVTLRAYSDGSGAGPVLLIVPAPIKRAYIWDLVPWASAVRRCVDGGLRVYLMEWIEPGVDERDFGLAEYADRFILDCLNGIEDDTGTPQAFLAGHSLGGTLAAIFSTLHPERVRGLVLLEAPLHFGPNAGALASLVATAPPATAVRNLLGNIPGSFLNLVSFAASPISFGWQRWVDGLASLNDPRAMETHIRVARWTMDELPLPGRLFEEVLELLYREDRFLRGSLRVGGRYAVPEESSAPLLSVIDPRSRIIPPRAILPFHEAVPHRRKRLLRYDGDIGVALQHVGALVGRNAHRHLWPEILHWLRDTDCT